MLHRRILYALCLAAVLLFQITNENYLAHLLLVLTLALPVLSLAVSLPGMLTCRLELSAAPGVLPRNGTGEWRVSVCNRSALPLARVAVRVETRSLFTGELERCSLRFSGVVRRKSSRYLAGSDHCGVVELRAVKLKVCDCLGLISLRRPLPEPARLLVEPTPVSPGPLNIPECPDDRREDPAQQGRGIGEDYELREYHPGDPMRMVHWKLSSKRDELIVREPLGAAAALPLFTFDHFGAPERADRVLDRLTGYSHALLSVQRPHAIAWLDPRDGRVCRCAVRDEKELQDCLVAILSQPCPLTGPFILERLDLLSEAAPIPYHFHVTAGEEGSDHGA